MLHKDPLMIAQTCVKYNIKLGLTFQLDSDESFCFSVIFSFGHSRFDILKSFTQQPGKPQTGLMAKKFGSVCSTIIWKNGGWDFWGPLRRVEESVSN